jgi:RNA-binding protein 25
VFNQDEEEGPKLKKHRLIPLDYTEEEKAALLMGSKPTTAEEKRKCIKNLIERIPTGKEELFDYVLDWSQVDQVM